MVGWSVVCVCVPVPVWGGGERLEKGEERHVTEKGGGRGRWAKNKKWKRGRRTHTQKRELI